MLFQLPPELQKALKVLKNFQRKAEQINRQLQPAMLAIQQLAEIIQPIMDTWRPYLADVNRVLRLWESVDECQTLLHPIYWEMFDPEFSVNDIKNKWEEIHRRLWHRFPNSLDKDKRKERYNQILESQTIGAYTPVCRAIYPELESLLRDELLFTDPNWKATFEGKESADRKRMFQTQQFTALVKNQHPRIKLVDSDVPQSLGVCTYYLLRHLREAFEKFDPAATGDSDKKSFRHIHAHGWEKEASFIDGLNGLLAFDMALAIVSEKAEERDQRAR